ncbi:MAG: hypothetical protein LBU19_10725, partial [Treponema sp.]|jgi:hypothetical protein|nr:hypothetical protein [Treponema sp.]
MNPAEAISLSNKLTYGNKGVIFLSSLVVVAVTFISACLLGLIPLIGFFFAFITIVLSIFVTIGMGAYIYKTLGGDVQ